MRFVVRIAELGQIVGFARIGLFAIVAAGGNAACSSQPTVGDPADDYMPGDDGPEVAEPDGGGVGVVTIPTAPSNLPGDTDEPVLVPDDNAGDDTPDPPVEGPMADPCEVAGCGPGQRCEATADSAACIDLTCEELGCSATEQCQPEPLGGNICVDVSCALDVDCAPEEYCGLDSLCQADVCEAGARSCDGLGLLECASNGGQQLSAYTCGSPAYFESQCSVVSATDAACTCEDDWDCPAFTVCEVNLCRGTGVAPTCTLPPTNFADTEPSEEIHWGGDAPAESIVHDGALDAATPPWGESSQVVSTPIVANLDDDNGDGAVNELDFPEIIFTTYQAGGGGGRDGVVRAIHGGGPNRGKDYFARCGELLWTSDAPIDTACEGGDAIWRTPVAVADLTQDQVPEIVYITTERGFRVLNNRGEILLDESANLAFIDPDDSEDSNGLRGPHVSIANLDFQGLPELIFGATVFNLGLDDAGNLFVNYRLDGAGSQGINADYGPMSCVADMHSVSGQEVLAGTTLFAMPVLAECAAPPCTGTLDVLWSGEALNGPADIPEGDGGAPPPAAGPGTWDGFCAVADVWGADAQVAPGPLNPPDGHPEAILISDGELVILNAETGALIDYRSLGGGTRGGAPNVDDFDGDGYMEVASALADYYVVVDLQEPTADGGSCPAWPTAIARDLQADQADNPNLAAGRVRNPGGLGAMSLPSGAVTPGSCETDADCDPAAVCNTQAKSCVCLHNGWQRDSDDDSSRATSSSIFDFNGDGAAEVVYNDECELRLFSGSTGEVLFTALSRSRTGTENPVVADVDNDGNAEVVTVANTDEGGRCDADGETPQGPRGLRVWGDAQDTWVSARRIWNQHSYHVTNITEGGTVVEHPPESWGEFNGRTYNTYRSQPRTFGVAPDLTVAAVSLFSPDAGCGQLSDVIEIVFEIKNAGDLRVGPGVQVAFYGTWAGVEEPLNGAGVPLTLTLDTSIEPGRSVIRSVTFNAADQTTQGTLPDSVRVVVDSAAGTEFGAERECNEDNNSLGADVDPGSPRPDLTIALGLASVVCLDHLATVAVTVTNSGTAPAAGVVVQIFAGDPGQGGALMQTVTLPDPIPAGGQVMLSVDVPDFPNNREITLWGWVDPDNVVEECNEADNTDPADNPIVCRVVGGVR